jgi:hypothetical protein
MAHDRGCARSMGTHINSSGSTPTAARTIGAGVMD